MKNKAHSLAKTGAILRMQLGYILADVYTRGESLHAVALPSNAPIAFALAA